MKKLKVELTVELRQRLTIRRNNTLIRAWCAACNEEVEMCSGEEAAMLIGKRSREIYRQAEQGSLHSGERPDGTLLVCVKSLRELVPKNQGSMFI